MNPRRILAIDPSIDETGAALLSTGGDPHRGDLMGIWRVKPEGDTIPERLVSLKAQVMVLVMDQNPDVLVLEMPADQARGRGGQGFTQRSVMTLPTYGAAVGILVGCLSDWRYLPNSGARTVLYPSSSDWTGRDVPSSRDDKYKERRVRYVEHLYRKERGSLGPKTAAGNIADAVLIARWGLWRTAV